MLDRPKSSRLASGGDRRVDYPGRCAAPTEWLDSA